MFSCEAHGQVALAGKRRRLSASRQNQALNALVFLYRHVWENTNQADHLGKFELLRSRRVKRIPTVLSPDEVRRLLMAMPQDGNPLLAPAAAAELSSAAAFA